MSRRRYAAKVDDNSAELTDYARACGLSVEPWAGIDGNPDKVIGGWGVTALAEIKRLPVPGKVKPSEARLSENQEKWRKSWRGAAPFLWRTTADVDETVRVMRASALRRFP
jgi:hypothetical protein